MGQEGSWGWESLASRVRLSENWGIEWGGFCFAHGLTCCLKFGGFLGHLSVHSQNPSVEASGARSVAIRLMTQAKRPKRDGRDTNSCLGPPVVPFCPFLGEGSPTEIDYRKKGALILTSLLEDLVLIHAKAARGQT